MDQKRDLEGFASGPVFTLVLRNAIPAMAAMLMVLIYNLADTFFIGQTHDAIQVAAVSLATPVFLIFMCLVLAELLSSPVLWGKGAKNTQKKSAPFVCGAA